MGPGWGDFSEMSPPERKRKNGAKEAAKDIRAFHLADMVTLCNSAAGSSRYPLATSAVPYTCSIFASLKYVTTGDVGYLYAAIWLLPLALIFDIFDGYVANGILIEALNRQPHRPMEKDGINRWPGTG